MTIPGGILGNALGECCQVFFAEQAEENVRENELGKVILGCAMRVHTTLGPGLL